MFMRWVSASEVRKMDDKELGELSTTYELMFLRSPTSWARCSGIKARLGLFLNQIDLSILAKALPVSCRLSETRYVLSRALGRPVANTSRESLNELMAKYAPNVPHFPPEAAADNVIKLSEALTFEETGWFGISMEPT
ncbi:hypothetical protein BDZ97DRAFT_1753612 [Flammula alnicola]|nr:hypothetical protein BDZ97DRAFT_1753612 [Flammula alnicola]